ncbi:MAG: FecR domain-containing protein [Gammaproteobacteria bacterium]|nr:FecR domain-containing protein [Gammaproteobacteria bacterium]
MNTMSQSMPLRSDRFIGMIVLVAVMALWSLTPTLVMAAPEPAGYVLMASGEFHAVQPNQVQRKLGRKSPFYPGEILRTSADSKAQVRFRDGSLIALRPETEIRIDEFRFEEPAKGEDKNIFTLINGGFRTITGKIGKKNPENYQMKSSVASIGVRGTTYEAVMSGGLNVAAWQGTIVVKNKAGAMKLGVGADYNFAVVPDAGHMAQGMLVPPTVLGNAPELNSGSDPVVSNNTLQAMSDQLLGDPSTLTLDVAASNSSLSVLADGAFNAPTTNQTQQLQSSAQITASTDTRLTNTEKASLDRIAVFGFLNTQTGVQQYRGLASNSALANQILTKVDLVLTDPGFFTSDPTWVVRQGSATLLVTRVGTPTKYAVTWGTWDATAAAPVLLQTDKTNPNIVTNQAAPVMWMTVLPTDKAVLANMIGGTSYTTMLANYGTGSGGLAQIDTHVLVDFNTASFRGYTHVLDLGLAGDWQVKYTGVLSGVSLDVTALDGVYTGAQGTKQAVTGRVDLFFVGAAPDALAGAFEFELVSNPAAYVQGQFVTERDFRIASSEALTMNSFSLISRPNSSVLARSTDLTSTAAPVMGTMAGWAKPGGMGFLEAKYTDVIRKGSATDLVATTPNTTFPTHPVNWGAWSSGWVVQTDPANAATQTTMAEPLYWMQLTPTDPAVIAAKTGSFTYSTPVTILGGGTGGAINTASFAFSATVNFNTGSLTSGAINFSDNAATYGTAANWDAAFTGNIQGSALVINAPTVSYAYGAVATGGNASGNINAVFTGPAAQMIGGNFNFAVPAASGGAPAAQVVQGVFLVQ